jgi:hypothetical protein
MRFPLKYSLITINIITILLLHTILYSQPVMWVKVIGDSTKVMVGKSVVQTYDNGYTVLGYSGNLSGIQKLLLVKLDYLGNIQWLKYPIDTIINADPIKLVQTKDSGFVMFGYQGNINKNFLVKTDKNGNFLWRKNYPDTALDIRLYNFENTLDNGFVLTGTFHNWQPPIVEVGYIEKVDSSGNRIWHKFYSDSSVTSFGSIIQLPDSCYYIGETTGAWPHYGFAKKLTKNGDAIWTKLLVDSGGAGLPVQVTNNKIALCSTLDNYYQYIVSYIDTSSNIIWQKLDSLPNHILCMNSVFNSSIVLTGFVSQEQTIGIRKLSLTDSILFAKSFLHPGYTAIGLSQTVNTNDNGFIITGDAEINYKISILIIKTDSLFNAPLITNISNVPKIPNNNFELFQNYPNPFNSSTSFKFYIPESGNIKFKIYDLLGREILYLGNHYCIKGLNSLSFNTNQYSLSSGIYLFTAEFKNKIKSIKFVLIK